MIGLTLVLGYWALNIAVVIVITIAIYTVAHKLLD
jgi:hypothetical protein